LYRNEFDDESGESREKIMAAEKRKRRELIMEQFALRRGESKEDEVSLLRMNSYFHFYHLSLYYLYR